MNDKKKAAAVKEAARLTQKYGHKAADVANVSYDFGVTSTGVLALDYKLGTGGWTEGHPHMIFGPRDIGKSSSLGLASIREAQRVDKLCGIIALEPGVDEKWMRKHGVDPESVVVARPNTGEEAFEIALEWCNDDLIDHIIFDSIGAVVTDAERDADELKSRVGGQSKLITDGAKRLLMPIWKNKKTFIYLNQVRDVMQGNVQGLVKPPGGNALEHSCATILQMKPVNNRYTVKIDGEDVQIGRTVRAIAIRNKLAEGTNARAQFDFYEKEWPGFPFGIDVAADVIATGVMTGVIEKAGAWYRHGLFPEGRLQGKKGVAEFIAGNPDAVPEIRKGVLRKMRDLTHVPEAAESMDE
ncbi:RecA family protein [Candidatus Solirubrobacter pratensis]|uniref:hypothetical protein n=1 Tax=Candidatus Solirubrobacter pratensis TaxID=1298857 RepID=UPI000428B683|nr:hypothetical protein [Candidatus Solirubrobacter pratensis]